MALEIHFSSFLAKTSCISGIFGFMLRFMTQKAVDEPFSLQFNFLIQKNYHTMY